MSDYLCIAATFLDPRFHGQDDGGEPEWPPSPLRLLQVIIAAHADDIGNDGDLDRALTWRELQEPPLILPCRKFRPRWTHGVPVGVQNLEVGHEHSAAGHAAQGTGLGAIVRYHEIQT